MVSYFIPHGRFLIRTFKLRATPKQEKKWPTRMILRRASSNNPTTVDHKVDPLMANSAEKNEKVSGNNEAHRKGNYRSRWFTWTGFLFGWAPMGLCVFGAIEWNLHKNKMKRENLPFTASHLQSKIYCWLPLRILSRCWGWLAGCTIPVGLRPFVYGLYSNAFNVNMNEALHSDYKYYKSLADFFTRPLKNDARCIDQKCNLVSPADGKVLHFGIASNSLIEQVKGVNYRIETFLGPPNWAANHGQDTVTSQYEEIIKTKKDQSTTLYQCVIYLAPGDYHRFHSPTEWQPETRRHFSGELLSVSPRIAHWMPGLFSLNERVLYIGKWKYGFFSLTAVGATNVGSVQIYIDEKLKTNQWVGFNVGAHKTRTEYDELKLNKGIVLTKGECLGQFNMGSSIVLLFEAPNDFKFSIETGQTIRMGEPLGFIE